MKLQTATRLGLYATLELARDPAQTLSSADLAERFGVSTHHLAKVLRTLSTAGLVRAERGASGGYRFTGNRRRITLMDIVALFEPAPGRRATGSSPTPRRSTWCCRWSKPHPGNPGRSSQWPR